MHENKKKTTEQLKSQSEKSIIMTIDSEKNN